MSHMFHHLFGKFEAPAIYVSNVAEMPYVKTSGLQKLGQQAVRAGGFFVGGLLLYR